MRGKKMRKEEKGGFMVQAPAGPTAALSHYILLRFWFDILKRERGNPIKKGQHRKKIALENRKHGSKHSKPNYDSEDKLDSGI
ncbi:hypothetical protein COCNU_12G000130 [Cocos nucifera]|uniref:Uncharacterized protein n=1 Tax=Cocos nucifera TaxID=13894 RepID=A0A8K0NAR0_COCNU|nr:hypothetical protein COCNU_12G000130 [Cocos nucifera]